MKMRLEKDSLGQHEVPLYAYYGIQTQRAVEHFRISGYRAHPLLICAMGMIKKAAAQANRELKLIDEKRARVIARAAGEVMVGKWNGEFIVDVYQAGAGVSFHMNANEVIANRAIELLGGKRGDYELCHPNDHVNCSQSTNDVFPTAMRLACVFLFDDVLRAVAELAKSFSRKASAFDRILKSGRTHLMDAVPIRLGQEFAAYATSMRRCEGVLEYALGLLKEVGLGGSAVGTGVNTHPKFQKLVVRHLSKISGQALRPTDDLRYAMQSNLAMSVASSALRNLALELIRISNDLRLLVERAEYGACGNRIACAATGIFDHAGESESGDGGTDRDGGISGDWSGHGHGDGCSSGATGAQCDDAGHGVERVAFGGNSEKHDASARNEVRRRHFGKRREMPLLCERHDFHRGGA